MNHERFETLISCALDNDLSPKEFAEFEQHLSASPEARALYLETVHLHNILDLELQTREPAKLGTSTIVDIQRIIRRQKHKTLRIAALSTAALILIGLISLQFFMVDNQPALSFKTASGTEFSLTHSEDNNTPEGMTMENGSRLQLSRGTVEFTFASGVRSIITAPADITLQKDDTMLLERGIAWFEVPKKALGFTVKTKDLNIIDLGTEFGVISVPGAHDEVHVFKGKVKVDALNHHKESASLLANEARRNDYLGRLDTIEANPALFLKELSELPPFLHWSFDENDKYSVIGSHPAIKEIVITPTPSHLPPKLVKGKYGSALSLNGKQQGLITNWVGIYGDERPLSTAVWVRIPNGVDLTQLPAIVGWGIHTGSKAKWKVQVTHETISEAPVARVSIGGHYYDGTTRIDDNQWHHIAAVYHGRNLQTDEPEIAVYIDGKRESLTRYTAPITSTNNDEYEDIKQSPDARSLMIGKGLRDQETTFRGLIDELYIFEGAISQEVIKQLITPTNNN